jgi:hypothetical protein
MAECYSVLYTHTHTHTHTCTHAYIYHIFFIHSSVDRHIADSIAWLLWLVLQWTRMCILWHPEDNKHWLKGTTVFLRSLQPRANFLKSQVNLGLMAFISLIGRQFNFWILASLTKAEDGNNNTQSSSVSPSSAYPRWWLRREVYLKCLLQCLDMLSTILKWLLNVLLFCLLQ